MRSSLISFLLLAVAPTESLRLTAHRRIDRRSATAGLVAALATLPASKVSAKFGDGCPECSNKELESSPLIEELKRRTAANKEQNAAAVRETTQFTSGVYEAEVKMVRYAGPNDTVPVTRMMNKQQIKELESLGFNVDCPSWGGACDVKAVRKPEPPPPPPPPPPVAEELQ